MNLKNVFIGIFLLSLTILSFSFISAQDNLEEFLSDDVTQITVTVTQNESWVDLFLDTSGTSFDSQNIDIQNETVRDINIQRIAFSFNISELLGDINGKIEIEEDSDIPQFNELDITENGLIKIIRIEIDDFIISGGLFTTKGLFETIFDNLDLNLNISNVTSVNNYLIQNPLPTVSDRHIKFTKQGNNYNIWNDEGYGNIPDNWKIEIRDKIEEGVEAINIPDLLEEIAPFLEQEDLNLSLFDSLDMNYSVGEINLSDIILQDGTYTISIPIEKNDGSASYTKNITLIIQGIQNEEISVPVSGTYTPTNPEVAYYLIGIEGLGVNTVSVLLFDVFSSTLPSNTKSVIKYIDISVVNASSGTIGFKVPVGSVSNPSLVSLYVLEGSSWVKLQTTLINTSGGFYEYEAITSHFSMFMMMETLSTTSGGGGGGRSCTTQWTCTTWGACVNGIQTRTCSYPANYCTPKTSKPAESQTCTTTAAGTAPIQATPQPPAPTQGFFAGITGAIIGALGTGGSIVVIVFIVSVVGLMVILRIKRRVETGKRKKLNEEGDKNEK